MLRVMLVVAAMFAVPATAVAVTTAPAKPTTISLSGAGGVRTCVHFTFTLNTSVYRHVDIILHQASQPTFFDVIKSGGDRGSSTAHYCPASQTKRIGGYTWYACVTPKRLNYAKHKVHCTSFSTKRWFTVIA